MQPWQAYQEEAAEFFRQLGLSAETNVTLQGVRTTHAIDVLVKSQHAGFAVTWIVECKHWKEAISKLHVLALRAIVSDLGADRGILLAEAGYQSGALEAAALTNVHPTSIADLRGQATHDISAMRLRDLYDRMELCRVLYWDIPKHIRIAHGLRPDIVGEQHQSGDQIIQYGIDVLARALRASYPFATDQLCIYTYGYKATFQNPEEVIAFLEPLIEALEDKLARARASRDA